MDKLDITLKNVGRCNFHLSLDFSRQGKYFDLKPNTEVKISEYEYNYLLSQCPKAFERGFLQVIDTKVKDIEVIESENVYSVEDIEHLFGLTIKQFKNKLDRITDTRLLKDILSKAKELGKDKKFLDAIENRAGKISDSLVL